jgi:hypothetical protein
MTVFSRFVSIASKEFITEDIYTWRDEFTFRSLHKGTYMPLTMYCAWLKLDYYLRPGRNDYAGQEIMINGDYELTNLGKFKFRLLNQLDGEGDSEFEKLNSKFSRTTCGTIGLWGLRHNERIRQLWKIRMMKDDNDWLALKAVYNQYRNRLLKVYTNCLDTCINFLSDIVVNEKYDYALSYMTKFILKYNKKQVSMIAHDRYPYYHIVEGHEDLKMLFVSFIQLLKLIKLHLYSKFRVKSSYLLSALRNRPLNLVSIKENMLTGWMDRSREANGQPPLSLLWMFVYPIKKLLYNTMLNEFERIFGIKFIDPIRDKDFYWKFTHLQDGLYLFGDNGMKIEHGKIICVYDLSISDVFQGFLRRDELGNNLCFFQRLDSNFDCGSTGGAFTTIWNIEGQLLLWRALLNKELMTDKSWPYVNNLCEESSAFLGHSYFPRMKRFITEGVRLTRDNARRSIPLPYSRGRRVFIDLKHEKKITYAEFAQLSIACGLGQLKMRKFYDWVRLKRLSIDPEGAGVWERIHDVVPQDLIPEFLSLFNMRSLDILASPLVLNRS